MEAHIITHPSGVSATVSVLGATLRTLRVPDRDGDSGNILVGFESPEEWLANKPFFGATVGRYANRIAHGKFHIGGEGFAVSRNEGEHHLHGGVRGFDKAVWKTEAAGAHSVKFSHHSPDGDEGYPGNLRVEVEYTLGVRSLTWQATATTDRTTPVNLTNHAYYNLSGNPSASVLGHHLRIDAAKYLPVDATRIPTGERKDVAGTPFDFTSHTSIGENLAKLEGTFDHNFILNDPGNLRIVAVLRDPASGRCMELSSNQPGLQLYLATNLGHPHSALCLEPQQFPDAPNRSDFPNPFLHPGEIYSHTIHLYFPEPE